VGHGWYREWAPDEELTELVRCVWHRRIGAAEANTPVRIVPDGCMDLMWGPGGLVVAGPDPVAQVMRPAAETEFVGLRFHPGAAPPLLGVPADELVGERPEAAALWGAHVTREPTGRLAAAANPLEQGALLQWIVRSRLRAAAEPDRTVRWVATRLERANGARVEALADRVGLSERQLHRRCRAALGYGPKTFAGIARFQRFLAAAGTRAEATLADLALESGYADQPHLAREVRRLTGLPPTELLAR
jgi:AraC-like DNA-binding protein